MRFVLPNLSLQWFVKKWVCDSECEIQTPIYSQSPNFFPNFHPELLEIMLCRCCIQNVTVCITVQEQPSLLHNIIVQHCNPNKVIRTKQSSSFSFPNSTFWVFSGKGMSTIYYWCDLCSRGIYCAFGCRILYCI